MKSLLNLRPIFFWWNSCLIELKNIQWNYKGMKLLEFPTSTTKKICLLGPNSSERDKILCAQSPKGFVSEHGRPNLPGANIILHMHNVYAYNCLFRFGGRIFFYCHRLFCSHHLNILENLCPATIAKIRYSTHHDTFWSPLSTQIIGGIIQIWWSELSNISTHDVETFQLDGCTRLQRFRPGHNLQLIRPNKHVFVWGQTSKHDAHYF